MRFHRRQSSVSVSRRLHLHRQSHRSCVRPDSISHSENNCPLGVLADCFEWFLCDGRERCAASDVPSPDYQRVSSGSLVQDKNFYVLTLLQQDVKARAELAADPALAAIVKKTAMEMTKEGTIAPAARDLEARAQAGARSMTSFFDLGGVAPSAGLPRPPRRSIATQSSRYETGNFTARRTRGAPRLRAVESRSRGAGSPTTETA